MSVQTPGAVVTHPVTSEVALSLKQAEKSLTCSVHDAAKSLGIGRDSCYAYIRAGRLKVLKLGVNQTRLRVPLTELEAFIKRELEATA
jgi:excisionase family DNA binding protein